VKGGEAMLNSKSKRILAVLYASKRKSLSRLHLELITRILEKELREREG